MKLSALILACLIASITAACSPRPTAEATPKDATGICHRRLQWTENDEIRSRYEFIIVRQSSKAIQDIERLETLENALRTAPFATHLRPNTWVGMWLPGSERDTARPPSCTSLPAFSDHP